MPSIFIRKLRTAFGIVPRILSYGGKKAFWASVLAVLPLIYFLYSLMPVDAGGGSRFFEVKPNKGLSEIAEDLYTSRLIRSAESFEVFALLTGRASKLKPGIYQLSSGRTADQILSVLVAGPREIKVVIPDDSSIARIDDILNRNGIAESGMLAQFAKSHPIEGYLYPDTYKFLSGEPAEKIVSQFLDNFNLKARPVLEKDSKSFERNLLLASLVEKEAADYRDMQLIAGILKKRLAIDMPLQVDASVCYLKEKFLPDSGQGCSFLAPIDFKIDSPYNTYLHTGLPPGPVGSPSVLAIKAVMNSLASPYLFYISDPASGRIIYAKTFEEQNADIEAYLKTNLKSK